MEAVRQLHPRGNTMSKKVMYLPIDIIRVLTLIDMLLIINQKILIVKIITAETIALKILRVKNQQVKKISIRIIIK